MLIKMGLDTKGVKGILDNDPSKNNLYLYGTNIKVFNPNILRGLKKPIVILRAGQYSKEIREQIIKKINSNVIFI